MTSLFHAGRQWRGVPEVHRWPPERIGMRQLNRLLAVGVLVSTCAFLPARAQTVSPEPQRQAADALHGPPPSRVSLFVGGGDKSAAGRRLADRDGVTPYNPNQVLTLEQFTSIAIAALKREGRELAQDSACAANIELITGEFTILLRTKQEACSVSFDASGKITRVTGARGFHGEGSWERKYKNGQPSGAANRSQPIRSETNSTSSATGSAR
jgi:hypothetical protein